MSMASMGIPRNLEFETMKLVSRRLEQSSGLGAYKVLPLQLTYVDGSVGEVTEGVCLFTSEIFVSHKVLGCRGPSVLWRFELLLTQFIKD